MIEVYLSFVFGGCRIWLCYMMQVKIWFLVFVVMVMYIDKIFDSYQCYLINGLWLDFDMFGMLIWLIFCDQGMKNFYKVKVDKINQFGVFLKYKNCQKFKGVQVVICIRVIMMVVMVSIDIVVNVGFVVIVFVVMLIMFRMIVVLQVMLWFRCSCIVIEIKFVIVSFRMVDRVSDMFSVFCISVMKMVKVISVVQFVVKLSVLLWLI